MNAKRKILLILIAVSFLITISTMLIERKFIAIVGNVCEVNKTNPQGHCYDEIPMWGFPIAFVKDNPNTSVRGSIGFEDYLNFSRLIFGFLGNWLIYYGLLFFLIRKL